MTDRRDHAQLDSMHDDFWLMDDEVAVQMVYDNDGTFLRVEQAADASPYVRLKDIAMECAEPLEDYLARTRVRLTA